MHLSIITWPVILQCAILLGFIIAALYCIGYGIQRLAGRQELVTWESIFNRLLIGLLISVSLYAAVITMGRTVLLLCPLLCILLGHALKQKDGQPPAISTKIITVKIACIIVVSFAAFLPGFISLNPAVHTYYGGDHTYYATLAAYLNATGFENNKFDFFDIHQRVITTYHYGDIWWLALLAKTTRINTSVALALLAYPSLAVIVSTGIAAVTERLCPSLKLPWWKALLLPLIVLVVSGYTFLYPSFIVHWNNYEQSFYHGPKFLVLSALIIGLFLYYYNKNHVAFSILASMSGLFILSAAPAILLSASVILIVAYKQQDITFRQLLTCCALLLPGLLYPMLFYKLFAAPGQSLLYHPVLAIFSTNDIKRDLVGLPLSSLLQLSCYLVQAAFIYFLYRHYSKKTILGTVQYKTVKYIILFAAVFLISGHLSMTAAYNRFPDSFQLYSQILLPIAHIAFSVMLLIAADKASGKVLQVAGLTILLINVHDSHMLDMGVNSGWGTFTDKVEHDRVLNFVKDAHPEFAELTYIGNEVNVYQTNTQLNRSILFLSYYYDPYVGMSINTPLIPVDGGAQEKYHKECLLNTAPFSSYYVSHGGTPASLGDIQLSYLREYNVHYLIAGTNELIPPLIAAHIRDSIALPLNAVRMFRLSF